MQDALEAGAHRHRLEQLVERGRLPKLALTFILTLALNPFALGVVRRRSSMRMVGVCGVAMCMRRCAGEAQQLAHLG